MKINLIAAALVLTLLKSSAFAQTATPTNQLPGPAVHKANISPAPTDVAQLKPDKKAARKAELAKMTPDERTAFKADRKAKKAAKLAAMTPEQRQAHDARKAEKKAARKKAK